MNGWFPVPHDIVDSPVFHDAETLRLFIWLSKRAAINTQLVPMTTGRGQAVVTLARGSCIVGRKQSALPLGWTESRFRYRLDKLEKYGLIRRICATHWTVIEIVNYGISGDDEEKSDQANSQANDQANDQPNATQTTNQTPQRNKTKNTKKTKKTEEECADSSADTNEELHRWIERWNRWHSRGLVNSKTSDTPNKGVRAGWARVQASKEIRELLSNADAIEAAIERSEFTRGPWFTLEKLLGGSNKDGALIVQKLLDGGYVSLLLSTPHAANVGAGVNYQEGNQIGSFYN